MSQHFLLSSRARTLCLATVFGLTDVEAEATFRNIRWCDTGGAAVCPACGSLDAYDCRRPNGAPRFRCRGCGRDFSITSGTLFASRKQPLRIYLAAIAIFCNELKGKSMLAMSRDIGISYKAAFVLCHKVREAMAAAMRGRLLGGENRIVEIDGAYFGGYAKPANLKHKRIDRRLARNLTGKRKVVVIARERGGESLPAVFKTEGAAVSFIKARIRPGTILHADEAASWDRLHAIFKVKRINHGQAYSLDGACTNGAEGYFSRLRRGEAGHGHHISGPYLLRYAQEAAFREDRRRISNGEQINKVVALALANKPSVDFSGYWQRHRSE
jgi:transposase-like protein